MIEIRVYFCSEEHIEIKEINKDKRSKKATKKVLDIVSKIYRKVSKEIMNNIKILANEKLILLS